MKWLLELWNHQHILQKAYFQKNSYIIQKRKMKTTKNGDTIKLVLPFPHFLWMLGTHAINFKEQTILNEPHSEQENTNRENINYEKEK